MPKSQTQEQRRQAWMRHFQQSLPVPLQSHVEWDTAIYYYLSGKTAESAARAYCVTRLSEDYTESDQEED